MDPNSQYFLAPLIYWCRDAQALIEDQALWNAIQIVTRHFRDHYHNQGKLEAFETIIEPLAYDSAWRLNETETPKLPMIYREGVNNFVSTLRDDPYYAIGFLAQSTEALADIRNTIGDNQTNIQKILNYVVPYYQDRASVDQAALMLFALDQAIDENPMGYSDAAIDGLKVHRSTIEANTKNRTEEEVRKIAAFRANLHEAQKACAVIAKQNFQDHPDFIRAGTVLAALRNNQTPETKTANLANPAQWILGTLIDTETLAAFFQVMGNLGSQGALSDDVKTAFQTLTAFSNNVLSSWAANSSFNHSKKFSLQDAIVSNQSTLSTMASAALLEEKIKGAEDIHKSRKDSDSFDADGLLDDLCGDDVDTKTLDPAKYASLILKMQWAKDHDDSDGVNKQSDAKALLPFLSKAIERFHEFRSQVDREKTRMQEFIDASRKVSFSGHPEFQDTESLIEALDPDSDYKMIKYVVRIQSVIDDIDGGVMTATQEQRQDAIIFKDRVHGVIQDREWNQDYHQTLQRIYKEKIALKAVVSADLPEFREIGDALCEASISSYDPVFKSSRRHRYRDVSHGGSWSYYEERVPHLPEKFLVATERALSRRDDLPPRVVQHLDVLQGGILEYWRARELDCTDDEKYRSAYLNQRAAFDGVVETLGAQHGLLQAAENPACMGSGIQPRVA